MIQQVAYEKALGTLVGMAIRQEREGGRADYEKAQAEWSVVKTVISDFHQNDDDTSRTMPILMGVTIKLEPDMPHDPTAAAHYALLINYPYDEAAIGNLIRKSPSEARSWLELQRLGWAFWEYSSEALNGGDRCVRSSASPDRCPHIDVELYFRFDGEVEPADEEDEVGHSCTMDYLDNFFACQKIGDGLWTGDWRPCRGYCAIVALKVLDYLTKESTDSLTSSMRNLGL